VEKEPVYRHDQLILEASDEPSMHLRRLSNKRRIDSAHDVHRNMISAGQIYNTKHMNAGSMPGSHADSGVDINNQ
jgi:hypothetical protein